MHKKVNGTKIFWTSIILGLPLLIGIGRLNPDVSALVDHVNKPLQWVSVDDEQIQKLDSLSIEAQCHISGKHIK